MRRDEKEGGNIERVREKKKIKVYAKRLSFFRPFHVIVLLIEMNNK